MKYGLWDQIRVDQGKEWILMLFVQESLAHFRQNSTRPPHLQGTSKQVCMLLQLHVVIVITIYLLLNTNNIMDKTRLIQNTKENSQIHISYS